MHELEMLPRHDVYCVPPLHSTALYVRSTLDIFPPLIVGGANTIWFGGARLFFVVISHFSSKGGHIIMMCPRSYMAIHLSDTMSQVIKIVQCLENTHNGYHIVLCRTSLNRGDVEYLGHDIPVSIHDSGGGGCKCMQQERFYTTHSIVTFFCLYVVCLILAFCVIFFVSLMIFFVIVTQHRIYLQMLWTRSLHVPLMGFGVGECT